jgi:hypothetical protein
MTAKLPYLSTPGTFDNAIQKMKAAATPPNFNNDFVQTKLQIKGGAGAALPPFFKKLGLVGGDGSPTALYQQLRNPATSGAALAQALKNGYRPLYEVNEYCHDLKDAELKGLILQVTGLEDGNRVAQLIQATFMRIKKHANFDGTSSAEVEEETEDASAAEPSERKTLRGAGFNIGYTINLNLPASTNIEVFNAIFKSLRENLLRDN